MAWGDTSCWSFLHQRDSVIPSQALKRGLQLNIIRIRYASTCTAHRPGLHCSAKGRKCPAGRLTRQPKTTLTEQQAHSYHHNRNKIGLQTGPAVKVKSESKDCRISSSMIRFETILKLRQDRGCGNWCITFDHDSLSNACLLYHCIVLVFQRSK